MAFTFNNLVLSSRRAGAISINTFIAGISAATSTVEVSASKTFYNIYDLNSTVQRIKDSDPEVGINGWYWVVSLYNGNTETYDVYQSFNTLYGPWFSEDYKPDPVTFSLGYTSACLVNNAPFASENGIYYSTDAFTYQHEDGLGRRFFILQNEYWKYYDLDVYIEPLEQVISSDWDSGYYPWLKEWIFASIAAWPPFLPYPNPSTNLRNSDVLVSGMAGTRDWTYLDIDTEQEVTIFIDASNYNGLYRYSGFLDGRPFYTLTTNENVQLRYNNGSTTWSITDHNNPFDPPFCYGNYDALLPWEIPVDNYFDDGGINLDLCNYNIKFTEAGPTPYSQFATVNENGVNRFRRLAALGYV